MTGPADIDGVIGKIYDAALEEKSWANLPAALRRFGDGGSCIMAVVAEDGAVDAATHGLPDNTMARYLSHYHSINPFLSAVKDGPSLCAQIGDDRVPLVHLRKTEFYQDFSRGLDAVQVLGGVFPVRREVVGMIGIHRGERHRRFGDRDLSRMQQLLPHMQRMFQLRSRLGVLHQHASGLAALDALAIGCIVADGKGRIAFANAAASKLAAARRIILGTSVGGVRAPKGDEARQLAALIADASCGGSGGALALTGPDRGLLFALVVPLPARFGLATGNVLITLRAADAEPVAIAAQLRTLFGLTPAEARLATALSAGRSLADIATEHGVSANTTRSQLASVLRKTDTVSQRELVRLLGLLPPLMASQRG